MVSDSFFWGIRFYLPLEQDAYGYFYHLLNLSQNTMDTNTAFMPFWFSYSSCDIDLFFYQKIWFSNESK